MHKKLLIAMTGLAIAGIIYYLSILTINASQTPSPGKMPPVVNESMDDLLQSLEIELKKYHPETIQFL